ncbi:hypothetical protein GCM10010401_12160 [Rarobacter faecitabidus]|uniref:Uncharacterized protein n=1 Tax=Rarobacter faecitabidus TaxID=13243 RepID=A0A542ZP58_RARFA|nr:hypothetical protein FB461_1679 [Rarobacter faecitabidus]
MEANIARSPDRNLGGENSPLKIAAFNDDFSATRLGFRHICHVPATRAHGLDEFVGYFERLLTRDQLSSQLAVETKRRGFDDARKLSMIVGHLANELHSSLKGQESKVGVKLYRGIKVSHSHARIRSMRTTCSSVATRISRTS